MNKFYVDQAGKVEHTSEDTILAMCSKEIQYSIRIPKELKQGIFELCKKRYRKKIIFKLFSYGLYLLFKNRVNSRDIVIVDDEYARHGRDIKLIVGQYLGRDRPKLVIDLIGKKNDAHRIANQTFSGRLKPNMVITNSDISIKKLFPKNILRKILK